MQGNDRVRESFTVRGERERSDLRARGEEGFWAEEMRREQTLGVFGE